MGRAVGLDAAQMQKLEERALAGCLRQQCFGHGDHSVRGGVAQPTFGHAALALIAVLGFLAAFLLIARADVEPGAKAANVMGAAVVSGICFAIVSEFL